MDPSTVASFIMEQSQRSVTAILDGAPYATRILSGEKTIIADEPVDHGGTDQGFRPHELLLSALASCTAITLRMYADRKGWAVSFIKVRVDMEREQEGAKVDTRMVIVVDLTSGPDPRSSASAYCRSQKLVRCIVPWSIRSTSRKNWAHEQGAYL